MAIVQSYLLGKLGKPEYAHVLALDVFEPKLTF